MVDERTIKYFLVVSSNANANGTADKVETSGAAHNYKTVDGIIGVNASSAGNATGKGSASLDNSASGSAGDKDMNSIGHVNSNGTNSNAYSNIQSAIAGNNMTIQSNQQGNANGVGDTSVAANGNAFMSQGGKNSPMSKHFSFLFSFSGVFLQMETTVKEQLELLVLCHHLLKLSSVKH